MYTENMEISCTPGEYADEMVQEFCARAHIDSQTCCNAVKLFKKISNKLSGLNKTGLRAACIYTICKQNGVPRTMGEIAGVTGCCMKQLGKYESLLNQKHYPVTPEDYIERFSRKLGLKFRQIKIIHEKITKYKIEHPYINPAAVTCCCIYNTFPKLVDMKKISEISGVPVSSIKRLNKKNNIM